LGAATGKAMMTTHSGDANRPRHRTTGEIYRQGTTRWSGVRICRSRRPAWTRSIPFLKKSHHKLITSRNSAQLPCRWDVLLFSQQRAKDISAESFQHARLTPQWC